MLLATALTEELSSGVVPAGAPELAQALSLSPAKAAGWTLFAMLALGAVIEPPLLALARGARARPMIALGFAGVAAACFTAAAAPSYPVLIGALLLYGPAAGVAVRLSEAALMAAHAGAREAVLARWTLLGLVGDLLAPLGVAVSASLGVGLRGALMATGLWVAAQGLLVALVPTPPVDDAADEEDVPVAGAFAAALRSAPLLGWSLAAVSCNLLDEVLVSFGALHLQADLGASPTSRAVAFAAWIAGGLLGAATLERLAAVASVRTLLIGSGAGAAVAYAGWLVAPTWPWAAAALGVTGFFAAAHHPLLTARAYATLPHRPHTVAAVTSLVAVLDLAVPAGVSLAADGFGLMAALAVLMLQPIAVIAAGAMARRT